MNAQSFFWIKNNTPLELHAMLNAAGEEYPVSEAIEDGVVHVKFIHLNAPGISRIYSNGNSVTVEYSSVSCAARGLGNLLSGIKLSEEKTEFSSIGIMLDCSRNAVMKVEYLKKWFRRLALMGYNQVLLYLEDIYTLPDEPFFGYMRGAYTEDELKDIDTYAASLGLEAIACIQTLGHMAQTLHRAPYHKLKDTGSVMLVDSEDTYKFIDKIIEFWSRVFSSRRIHIGMDEAGDLGRGRFIDLYGYERGFNIFNRHLQKVSNICDKYGLRPMIWSDMYFRLGAPGRGDYDQSAIIPEDVRTAIPPTVDLVYWEYSKEEKADYADVIRRHRNLAGCVPVMATGIWTCIRTWYDHKKTFKTVKPCLDACNEEKVKEVLFTLWQDDGAYCEYDSALAGLCWAAELAYGGSGDEKIIKEKFRSICSASYENYLKLSEIHYPCEETISEVSLLWDDPLFGINWNDNDNLATGWVETAIEKYRRILLGIEPESDSSIPDEINHGVLLLEVIIKKLEFRRRLLEAYHAGDRAALANVKTATPEMCAILKQLLLSFRKRWMLRNKPFGFEVIQLRLNSAIGRYEEIAMRLDELLSGKISNIPELDETRCSTVQYSVPRFFLLATGSLII